MMRQVQGLFTENASKLSRERLKKLDLSVGSKFLFFLFYLLLLHLFVSFPFFLFVFVSIPLCVAYSLGFTLRLRLEKKTAFVLRFSPLFL